MTHLTAIVGPTGVGKSALAMAIAEKLGATILSVDSMQVYCGMDIGTAKPTADERARVRHRMIDVVEPSVDYSVADFQVDARAAVEEESGPILIVGGSGLHFRALVDPLEFPPSDAGVRAELEATPVEALVEELTRADPLVAGVLDVHNPRRVVRAVEVLRITGQTPTDRAELPAAIDVRHYRSMLPIRVFGVDRSNADELDIRLRARVDHMRSAGLLDEVAALRDRLGRQAAQAVGYRELIDVVDGRLAADAGFERIVDSTRALVKRQRTFFRRDPRIDWFDLDEAPHDAEATIMAALTQGVRA